MIKLEQLSQYVMAKSVSLGNALDAIKQSLEALLPIEAHLSIQPFILELKKNTPDSNWPDSFLKHLENVRLVDSFRELLDKVVSTSSKKAIVATIQIHFSTTKDLDLLNVAVEGWSQLIDMLIEYKKMQIQSIAGIIGFTYATHLNEKLNEVANKHPDGLLELIVLKRHEVCSNLTKGFGFFKDADLDATREDFFSHVPMVGVKQTIEDLYAAQQTQTWMLDWLKVFGRAVYVDLRVSPVSRAVSTALCATYNLSNVNQMTFDSNMVEQQWPVKQICSGQPSRKPSEWVQYMKDNHGFEAVHIGNDELVSGETRLDFDVRVTHAKETILAPNPRVLSDLRLNITVAHGDVNKAIMNEIRLASNFKSDIPMDMQKLDYGEQYILVGVRHQQTKALTDLSYLGIYSPHGHRKVQVANYFVQYFALQSDEERGDFIKKNKDSMLDHLPELSFRQTEQLPNMSALLGDLLREHLNEVVNRPDNSTGKNYGLDPSKTVLQRVHSAPMIAGKALVNNLTNKSPEPQQRLLEDLGNCRTLEDMQALSARAREQISKGKVTKLIDAFIRIAEASQNLPITASEDTPRI